MKQICILTLLIIAVVTVFGCSESNDPPSTPTITPSATSVVTSQQVNLTALAMDPDGDPITYDWQATGGSFNVTSGASTMWISPTVAGTYTITVNAKDSHGASSASSVNSVNIVVSAPIIPGNGGGGDIPGGGIDYKFVTSGLVSYWSFDQSSIKGNIVEDLWGTNNGIIMGGARVTTGKAGEALDFDGTDDHVDCGDGASLNITNSITVEFWINPRNGAVNGHVVSKGQWGAGGYWVQHGGALANETNFIYFYAQNVYQGGIAPKDTTTVNTWQHIVVTYDGASIKAYKDGVLVNSEVANDIIKPSSRKLMIGKYAAANLNYFNGILDEIRLYNRALTAAEVQQNYSAN